MSFREFGNVYPTTTESGRMWNTIHDILAREVGVLELAKGSNSYERCQSMLLTGPTERVLDLIDLSFKIIDLEARRLTDYEQKRCGLTQRPDDAIDELNVRFKENGVGYQFVARQLVKFDAEYLHVEAVLPAIAALQEPGFAGALEEFMKAQKHYRDGQTKEAIAEALKAFESCMKIICDKRGWAYPSNATAKDLIGIIFDMGLVPSDLQSSFTSLRSLLESSLPTLRNRRAGHGQGAELVPAPEYLASFALHLAASDILLLVEAHRHT